MTPPNRLKEVWIDFPYRGEDIPQDQEKRAEFLLALLEPLKDDGILTVDQRIGHDAWGNPLNASVVLYPPKVALHLEVIPGYERDVTDILLEYWEELCKGRKWFLVRR